MNPNDEPRHPAEGTGVSNRDEVTDEPIGECEQCNRTVLLTDSVTETYAGINGDRVVLVFCRECGR